MTAYATSDTVSVANFPAVQQITGSVIVAGMTLSASFNFSGATIISGSTPVPVTLTDHPQSSSLSLFTGSLVNATFLSLNASRKGAIFVNDDMSSGSVYVRLGPVASVVAYSVKLKPGSYYELPFSYVGRIDGVWDTVSGSLFVTEIS